MADLTGAEIRHVDSFVRANTFEKLIPARKKQLLPRSKVAANTLGPEQQPIVALVGAWRLD
jgi:hypothetical protein